MTLAIQRIYIAAFACALLCLLFTILMREVPLRRTIGAAAPPQPTPAPAQAEAAGPLDTPPATRPAGGQ
jgi:hypothetical protein